MVETVHILTGAALATGMNSPILGFSFAFISHYLLDSIPHQEYSIENIKTKNWKNSFFDFLKIALDISFGIILVLIFSKNIILALAGGLFATLPDILISFYLIFPKVKLLKWQCDFHLNKAHFVQKQKNPLLLGILIQALIIVIAIFFLQQ